MLNYSLKRGTPVRNTSTIKQLLFATLLLSPLFTHAETNDPSQDPSRSVNISPTFTNNNMAPNYTIENKPQFINYVSSLSYAVGMKIKDVAIIWMEYIKKNATPENYEFFKGMLKEVLWYYRYKIAGGTIIGSYSATSILLLADHHYLHSGPIWARWKPECTFEDLCAIPQKELARELLLAIGQQYYDEKNPTNLANPLIQFINSIDTEIRTIKRYITTTKIIKRLHLIIIFPTNETKLAQAEKLLERTFFIKHIFLSWLSEYNLTSNYKN